MHFTLLLSSSPISLSVRKLTSWILIETEISSVLTEAEIDAGSASDRQPEFHCPVEPVGSLAGSPMPSMYLSELRC